MTEENVKVKSQEAEQYRCENCGSEMTYSPETNSLYCEACDSTKNIEVEEFEIIERDLFKTLEKFEENTIEINEDSIINEVVCQSCGARSIFNGQVFADKCVYCGSAYVLSVDVDNYIRPEYIIPFSIEKTLADEKIVTWAKSQFYMNSKFKKNIQNDGLYGVYISYWTFDIDTVTPYKAQRGDYYYVTVRNSKGGTSRQRRTRWRNVSGTYKEWFDDLLVPAVNNKIPSIYEQSEKFDTSVVLPYDEQYITGFLAMKYEVELEAAWEIGKGICKDKIESKIKREIGGDEVRNLRMSPDFSDITFKHVLLPLWLCGYTYKDKIYTFIVNGQNGSVTGKYPLDALRITLTIIAIGAFLFGIWMAIN